MRHVQRGTKLSWKKCYCVHVSWRFVVSVTADERWAIQGSLLQVETRFGFKYFVFCIVWYYEIRNNHFVLYKYGYGEDLFVYLWIRGCIQKFPDWPPGARTANGIALCYQVQLYHYFVSQSSEFCRHNPLCCFSTSNTKDKHIFRYRFSPETSEYTLVHQVRIMHACLYCIKSKFSSYFQRKSLLRTFF
jgi:hypothetical protein